MAIITHKCPHTECLTEHIGLWVVGVQLVHQQLAAAYLQCPRCKLPSVALLQNPGYTAKQLMEKSGDLTDIHCMILAFWPEPPGPQIPDHLPPEVARVYLQAERNFPIAGNEEAAGTMYRKALDIGLKIMTPSVGGTLKSRIAELVKQHILTASLGERADQIRLLGNDAAHDVDEPTRDELDALRNFSDLLLQYLFTLPTMVAARRATHSAPGSSAS
jgi:hypothetical protein